MNKKYYNVFDDFKAYPDFWCYVGYSERGPGKTYGFLWGCLKEKKKFLYLKRTQVDIDLISRPELSPFKPIMRDHGITVETEKIYDGISAVYVVLPDQDPDGGPQRELAGYCLSMSAVHKYKGFDLSECEYMCLDEFIPQLTERVNRKEGELLLDLYMTVSRDREARGRDPLKLILFANATELYCPITDILSIVDDLAELNATGEEYKIIWDRGIMIHHIPGGARSDKDTAIFKGMAGTQWADMAFGGKFAYNDFSKVERINLKGFTAICGFRYQRRAWYIYQHKNNGFFYCCRSPAKVQYTYDLDIESDQSAFYDTFVIDLQQQIIDGNMKFQSYSVYNLIRNYRKIFKNI